MCERRTGSVLVLDDQQRLTGIFTGRDAVRALAEGKNAEATTLAQAMTPKSSSGRRERKDLGRRLAK